MNSKRSNQASKRELIGDDDDRIALERSRLLLEQENENRLLELRNKMSSLKSIAVDIDGEVKQQNRYLDGMGNDMSNVANGMQKALNKVSKLLSNADQPTLIVIILGIVLVFIVIWKLFTRK
ncbi:hypothetical protein JH06_4822 [Blastocystis sp. subtype 4]|uniref:hypothetical protein n=1 Tax=Blastocystis sp. subtype 4 TaxID=944170 RepID=UPI000711A7F8|nr:hypothetical protein JH06_4822 [Blastocystis sp. subtype 4]KNB42154.1 hypothetical protein JH06_4822 [Blastocystis sp. subtype 4]|eukprot:XP_014525597.1 hypothetical protein JH06_4822 [Blastocystis sp. subtype 4]